MRLTIGLLILQVVYALEIPAFMWYLAIPSKTLESVLPSFVMDPLEAVQKELYTTL